MDGVFAQKGCEKSLAGRKLGSCLLPFLLPFDARCFWALPQLGYPGAVRHGCRDPLSGLH
jgi:hypothetical protein